jgi:hypothetical protein
MVRLSFYLTGRSAAVLHVLPLRLLGVAPERRHADADSDRTGPDRPGLHKSNTNPWDESDTYVSTRNPDGSWGEPVNLGFNGTFGDSSGMEFNNGNSFIWLRGNGTTNDIVMAHKTNGVWGAPTSVSSEINYHASGVIQDNPHISPDGTALWFTSSRPGSDGKDIWFSFFSNGSWSNPVNAGAPFSAAGDDDQFWVNPVGLDIYWNSSTGLKHCLSNGSTCASAPTTVTISGCDYIAEASMPDDGQSLYFACADLTTYKVKIMYSTKQSDGSWGPATPVD